MSASYALRILDSAALMSASSVAIATGLLCRITLVEQFDIGKSPSAADTNMALPQDTFESAGSTA